MALTITDITYGPKPWHQALLVSSGSATLEMCYIPLAGGGWGLRDAAPYVDLTAPAKDPIAQGALWNASSSRFESFKMVVPIVASASHNGFDVLAVDVWSTAGLPASGGDYRIGALARVGTASYRCTANHTPTALLSPELPAAADYWELVASNDNSRLRVDGRGDGTPSFGVQGALDMQRLVGYLRANHIKFGIDPDKILTRGDSAGGQGAGLAAYMDQMDYGGGYSSEISHPYRATSDTRPNATILGITPTYLDKYVTIDEGGNSAQMRSFLGSLYGDPNFQTFSEWDEYSLKRKKSLDVLRALERYGTAIPTWLDYRDGLQQRDNLIVGVTHFSPVPEDRLYNGSGVNPASAPAVHHPYNGWKLFEELTKPKENGGHGRTDCRFWQSSGTAEEYEEYTQWQTVPVSGVDYTTQTVLNADYVQTVGEKILDWADAVM